MEILNLVVKLAGGVGLFLFAMYLIEQAVKNLSGRNFKLFLQRITKNRFGAVAGGAAITGLLQSSSMVSLMVLAFVGAGVFSMKNAMAIILGANLGTTLTGWLVATLGFKVNIEVAAYPAVAIGGLLLMIFENRKAVKYASYFLLGFGLVFIGLSFMKSAMDEQVKAFDFSKYAEMSLLIYLLIGFVITTLVQSSSVTMAITLSALNAGAVDFPVAAAIVLGSETGTTVKIVLSALGGSVAKKRVALGNLIFNIFLTVVAFALLKPTVLLITKVFGISDPLIGLVTFSSLTNFVSIMVFVPFLDPFAKFLEKLFKSSDSSAAAYISNANTKEPETAMDLFRKETEYFIHNSMLHNLLLFEINTESMQQHAEFKAINDRKKFVSKTPEEKYEFLKQLQGELQAFYLEMRRVQQDDRISPFNQLISAVRSSMHSVKSMKDIATNISNLKRSSKDIKFQFFMHHQKETEALYAKMYTMLAQKEKVSMEKLTAIFEEIQDNYTTALNDFYKEAQEASIEDLDITTALNFNRELFTSNKAMLMAVKDFTLDEKQAEDFNEIPVYKT
jgi:phosphate:Na+ symporter